MTIESTWLRAIIIGGGFAALPLTVDIGSGSIVPNEAACQESTTCCPELGSLCCPSGGDTCHENYYDKGTGSCKS